MEKERKDHPVLTVEWLRTYKAFENHSDEEAREAVETIRVLAQILMGAYKRYAKENLKEDEKSGTDSILWKGAGNDQEQG